MQLRQPPGACPSSRDRGSRDAVWVIMSCPSAGAGLLAVLSRATYSAVLQWAHLSKYGKHCIDSTLAACTRYWTGDCADAANEGSIPGPS